MSHVDLCCSQACEQLEIWAQERVKEHLDRDLFAELFDRRVQQAQTMGVQRTDLAVQDDLEQLVPAPEVAVARSFAGCADVGGPYMTLQVR